AQEGPRDGADRDPEVGEARQEEGHRDLPRLEPHRQGEAQEVTHHRAALIYFIISSMSDRNAAASIPGRPRRRATRPSTSRTLLRPKRTGRSQGHASAIHSATTSASGRSRSARSARTQDCTTTSCSSEGEGYR